MQILLPTREDVLLLHDLILSSSTGRPGLLNNHQLESALHRPYTYMQYEDVDIHTVAALLIDSFSRNHVFSDANKRTALLCAIYTYSINQVFLEFSKQMNQDFEDLVLWVVNTKPEIPETRQRLIELTEKYQRNNIAGFLQSFRDFLTGI